MCKTVLEGIYFFIFHRGGQVLCLFSTVPLWLNKLGTLLFIGNVLRTSASGHLEWITICCHSRPDAPHIESSVDLGIVWEVESGGVRGTRDLWAFRGVQIKDLTTPALSPTHDTRANVYIYGGGKKKPITKSSGSCGGGDDAFSMACVRKRKGENGVRDGGIQQVWEREGDRHCTSATSLYWATH